MGLTLASIGVLLLGLAMANTQSELTPRYFNLATGRKIYATATCGQDTDGPELYCKLVGANTENDHIDYSVIQGQVCDYCDPNVAEKNHPPENAIDGTEAWWQSPPLSRGMKFNEVNLTINFEQEFHVAYLFIRMGNSPRPGLWTLEKSADYGKTWTPWQHFSDTPADCETYFGKDTYKRITRDDDVICTTEYSKIVPLENGEIPVMLLNERPSATNYFNSTVLQEWTRATNVRIRLLRTKNLLGHLMSVARQDPTVTRRYFYSIKDISIGGRCMCNGHADTCDVKDPKSPVRILACRCQHHTCGIQCNECCPGFEQKKWRQNTNARPFTCEPCNCHGHSNECKYDEDVNRKGLSLDIHGRYEGGGVCQNCQHNTVGINCNKCQPKYYRPRGKHWNETDVCSPCQCDHFYSTGHCEEETGNCECRAAFQPPNCDSCAYGYYGYPNCRECECNLNGTNGYHCEAESGQQCPCKINFAGAYCKQCAEGYYGFPECKACECNKIGSITNDCNVTTGECKCLTNFGGDNCERCKHGYFNYPTCSYCDCDNQGTESEICNKKSGQCICREGFGGPRCDQCLPGYFNYPDCKPCNCSGTGSSAITCDNTGKCNCLNNFAGKQCTLCSAGYYSYPDCLPCHCDSHGSEGVTCNADGQCFCQPNFDGRQCDSCKEGFYNFPSCEDCNCDPAGVIDKFAGCGSVPVGELCKCKDRVQGRICNECKPLFWNLNISNPEGCETCECWTDGTISALDTCASKSGQCPCKPHTQGRRCQECKDGTFDLDSASLFGCKDCSCDVGGSWNSVCDKISGQCKCHPRVTGRACTQPLTTHFFPTLHQFQYEYEDGSLPSGTQVRYDYEEAAFPGFSSKGYVVFNAIQNEVRNEVNVFKSSLYRIVLRYVNPNTENVTATISITSDNPLEVDQHAKVLLQPTLVPQFVTVSGPKGIKPSAIVMDPGRYVFTTKANKNVMLDYFVLLPAAYYEAGILTRHISNPCELGNMELCRHYKYTSVDVFEPAKTPFVIGSNSKPTNPTEVYTDPEHLQIVSHVGDIPVLSETQKELNYIVDVPQSGRYIFVIDYISERNFPNTYYINLKLKNDPESETPVLLYPCLYSTICRTSVNYDGQEKPFYINKEDLQPVTIYADISDDFRQPIISVTAIPVDQWSIDYIDPSPVCVIHNQQCATPKFRSVPDSKKIEFETDHEDRIATNKPPYAALDEKVKLVYLDIKDEGSIVIESKVSDAKPTYVILVKYYQPNHPKYQVHYTLTAGKNQYDGKFDIQHCPSSSGCRGVIRPAGEGWFEIDDEFKFTITNNRPLGVWLDYLVVVPLDQYNDDSLVEETFDQTKEFIHNCGHDHFHITHNASEFCKKSVFSLTADYNSGALPCNCDYAGSTSFECHPFGGQCQCKPNVIERQCGACRSRYYGFPDCKPCKCPNSAMCEPTTGECMCPPNVIGDLCEKCAPNTYGFHQVIGCEECGCHPMGIANGNAQCDLFNGTCECRDNIEGRACDVCSHGFYNFPHCQHCSCHKPGTELEVCDKVDGSCFCKKNVVGRDCDQCIDGTYNLQDSNPEGCTTCFCFGKSSRCDSAYLRVYNVSLLRNASISTPDFREDSIKFEQWHVPMEELFVNETILQADFTLREINDERPAYFGVFDYLANQNSHLSSYGGDLAYTLQFPSGYDGKSIIAPDVILFSKHKVLVHQSWEQPSRNQAFTNRVQMVESNFQTLSGQPVSRADFMMVLRDLVWIYIRANYWEHTLVTHLADVYLQLADEDTDGTSEYQFLAVERCSCPPGYVGHSCEDCAPGYYRDPSGPYGGYCIPCECNGHSETCDCATGICTDCQHGTQGDHCEQCVAGYYGDATRGTPGDCMICACPLPFDSNNFATSCEISESGNEIHCECQHGYTGPRCESCANGFYGQPESMGEVCKPCDCSGNINPEDTGSCDTRTGECLRCLNNTFGAACNLCAPGFYGDAIKLKNCQSCDCDDLGTLECDPFVGKCTCHENVIGERCDRCKPDHYGFESGLGCRACDCGSASNSTQCDPHTGHCACKPGVTGRQCDRCAVDHWKYEKDGCTPCNCNQGYSRGFGCNPNTGKCQCLPGVIGDRCDACPNRWVLIKDEGCQECNNCHHALLDVTDRMRYKIDNVLADFNSVTLAFFTSQKLNYYDELADELEPKVKALDPTSVDLSPSKKANSEIEAEAKLYAKQVNQTLANALDIRERASTTLGNITDAHQEAIKSADQAKEAIAAVEALSTNLEAAASTKIDAALEQAQSILNQINETKIELLPNEQVLDKARKLYEDVNTLVLPIKEQNKTLLALKNDIGVFSDNLEDLYNWSKQSQQKSADVELKNAANQIAFDNSKFDTVSEQQQQAEKNINEAGNFLINGDLTLNQIEQKLDNLREALEELGTVNKKVDDELPTREVEHNEADKLTEEAELKAAELAAKAQDLAFQYADMTASAEPAIKAATAYSEIVDAVESAQQFSQDAITAAGNATQITDGIEDRAGKADSESSELLQKARQSLQKVQDDLQPRLNESASKVQKISGLHNATDQQLIELKLLLEQLPAESQRDMWKNSNTNASDALDILKNVLEILKPVSAQTPKELEKAQGINRDLDLTNKDISQAFNQLDKVEGAISNLGELADNLEDQQQRVGEQTLKLGQDIENLKRQVEAARQAANKIKVGVNFRPSTILELKTPEKAKLLATRTNLSFYFHTNELNGFLLYLGNDNKTAQKNNDFLAVEVNNGYPILLIDTGNGPARIVNQKYVSDGKWYQAVVDRVGPKATLTIREQTDDRKVIEHENSGNLEGPENILHVDRNSRLFVGGYPPQADFNAPEDLTVGSFNGVIEDLRIGDEPVGLWNFVYGQDNDEGAQERDVLQDKERPVTGLRFKGTGYAQLNTSSNLRSRSSIEFRFKADKDAANGLLFFYGRDKHFMSIEMIDGAIYFNISLGEGGLVSGNQNRYNDGRWHKVLAERDQRQGLLKIDDIVMARDSAPKEADVELPRMRRLFFGGHPRRQQNSSLHQTSFEGCIDDVVINSVHVDLTEYVNATGVEEGCADKFSTVLSYAPNDYGFLRVNDISSAGESLYVELRFRTRQPKGVLFYAANFNQSYTLGLALDNGLLQLNSLDGQLVLDEKQLNDGEEHRVIVQNSYGELRLSVDDLEPKRMLSSQPPKLEGGDIFFAGLPDYYRTPRNALATTAYFVGCISDVTVNNEIINFANSVEKKNGNINANSCPPSILAYDPTLVPSYYPSGANEVDENWLNPDDIASNWNQRPTQAPTAPPATTRSTTTTTSTTSTTTTTTTTTTQSPNSIEEEDREKDKDAAPQRTLTTRPPPKLNEPNDARCKLPGQPNYDVDYAEAGYRFYGLREQRLEVSSLPVKLRRHHDIGLSFRTEHPNGLLFYAGSKQRDDYIAVYLLDGKVHHEIRVGELLQAKISSQVELNDGKWHTVEVVRTNSKVSLIINQVEQEGSLELKEDRAAPVLAVEMPIFFGGINKFLEAEVKNLTAFRTEAPFFNGCLKEIKFNRALLNTPPQDFGVVPCSEQVERGVFFNSESSYAKLFDRFVVGTDMTISFNFRPRDPNGLVFSTHGKNSYAILELVDNTLHFTVKSDAKNTVTTNFTLPNNQSFCDGVSRNVQAIKSKFVINIAVDYISSNPGLGTDGSVTTKTNRPLFLGGHQFFHKAPGIVTKKTFKGCINQVEINKKPIVITPSMIYGDVWQGYCPTN